jgi:hypothetical protein
MATDALFVSLADEIANRVRRSCTMENAVAGRCNGSVFGLRLPFATFKAPASTEAFLSSAVECAERAERKNVGEDDE